MNTFDQQTFLDEHIPYRLGNLDALFHALRILNSEPRTRSVILRFDTGHEIRGGVSLVTNAWVETGIITCRTLLDFLEGKTAKGHNDDVTICSFSREDGQHLAAVPREKIEDSRPSEVTSEFALKAFKFAYQAANKGVAHLTVEEFQTPEAVELIQTACLTLKAAVHIHLYDALGIPRPPSMIRDLHRSAEPGL